MEITKTPATLVVEHGSGGMTWHFGVTALCRIALAIAAASLLGTAAGGAIAADGAGGGGSVRNATFTSAISDGAPTDFREQFSSDTRTVYYYGELLGFAGQTVTHRWKREGKVMQEVKIPVQNAREPAWSRNEMQPEWTGAWTVEVVGPKGEVIRIDSFAYNPPL